MTKRIYPDRILTKSEKVKRSVIAAILRGQCGNCFKSKGPSRSKKYCNLCLDKANKRTKERREQLWNIVLDHYGAFCHCPGCLEDERLFLTVDHKNNDGFLEKNLGPNILYKIIRENFPERYQIFCWNCNCGKARNKGTCPHTQSV